MCASEQTSPIPFDILIVIVQCSVGERIQMADERRRNTQTTPHPWPRRRALLLTPLAALVSARLEAAAPPAAPPAPRRFGDMVGLGVKFSQGQPLRELDMLLDLRVRWVRDAVHWPEVEPASNRFRPFSPALVQQLEFYRRHDIGLVALLTLFNPRAYPGAGAAPFDPQAFARFAVQVARQLREAGVRFVLEIGNEPHNSNLAKTLGGAWNGRPPAPWVDHYVHMVHAAVAQVKAFDPSIKLLSDDDMWVLHYQFLEAGLPRALDGFAIHPYTPHAPERTAVAHDTDWVRPYTVVDPDRSFGSAVRRLRAQGLAKLGHSPEIWITEWGWAVGGPKVKHSVPDETLVAYLPRAFILAAAAGVEAMCWFSAQDSVDGPMGLTRNDGTKRDTYLAFKTLTTQLGDHTLRRQIAGQANPTSGLQAFVFDGPQGRKLVTWSADNQPRQLPWRTATGRNPNAVDALGRTLPTPTSALNLGMAPIYVTTEESDAELTARFASAA